MKKYIKIITLVIILCLLWWISQIIFSIWYSTQKQSYLWIRPGKRVHTIAPNGGYLEQHIDLFTSSTPKELIDSPHKRYQYHCTYGIGHCITMIGHNFFASLHWIQAIQYIAQEVNTNEPSDLTNRFATILDYKPRRYYPYILLQYLGMPSKDNTQTETKVLARNNTIQLGEQGIALFCDINRIQAIELLSSEDFERAYTTKDPTYRNPCQEGGILAHTLAFNYFYYHNNIPQAIKYYKIASFHNDVPGITASMPALISSKQWDHKTSAYLRYDKLQNALYTYEQEKNLESDKVASLENTITKSLQKTVSEYNLHILEQANANNHQCHTLHCLKQDIQRFIQEQEQQCHATPIDCQILALGQQQQWIHKNGTLTSPISGMIYTYKEGKFQLIQESN